MDFSEKTPFPKLGDKFGESLGGSQAPPSFWEVPGLPRKFPELPRKFFGDFPGSSLTVELNSNPEVPRKFPKLPRKFPKLPRKSPDFPGGQPRSLGSLTPSSDSQKISLKNTLFSEPDLGTGVGPHQIPRATEKKKRIFSFFLLWGNPVQNRPQTQPLQVAFSPIEKVDLRSQREGIMGRKIAWGRVGWTGQKKEKGCAKKKERVATRATIYKSLQESPGPTSQESLKNSLLGDLQKVPENTGKRSPKIPGKVKKSQNCPILGISYFFGKFRGLFCRPPNKTLLRFFWGCGFLLTVGSFLLTVELFYLQLIVLAFLLTV